MLNISETVQDRDIVTMVYRNLCSSFSVIQIRMTLNDFDFDALCGLFMRA